MMDFKLPDLGEGIHEGEIVKWLVKEGDQVKEDQALVEVMTDKATVEIPSPAKGKIQKIYFKEKETVKVGDVVVTIAEEGSPEKKNTSEKKSEEKKTDNPQSAQTKPSPSVPDPTAETIATLATPAVRKLAKDLNIDLTKIKGTGPGGRITEEDVKKRGGAETPKQETSRASTSERFSSISIQKLGPEERLSLHGIRKSIAHRLQMAKYYAPHFTYVEEVDMTNLVSLREKEKKEAEKEDVKLTYLAYIVKAVIPVLKEFPYLNASLDETTQEIVFKKYYNIGIAVATPDGLIVPVVKDAEKKNLYEVAKDIVHLSDLVKTHKARPEDLKGSTFSITSIGSIGGVLATPILNYPDVAILGVNQIKPRPVARDGKIVIRDMVYLSLTLDHRVVDGAMAAEFMNQLVKKLENI